MVLLLLLLLLLLLGLRQKLCGPQPDCFHPASAGVTLTSVSFRSKVRSADGVKAFSAISELHHHHHHHHHHDIVQF